MRIFGNLFKRDPEARERKIQAKLNKEKRKRYEKYLLDTNLFDQGLLDTIPLPEDYGIRIGDLEHNVKSKAEYKPLFDEVDEVDEVKEEPIVVEEEEEESTFKPKEEWKRPEQPKPNLDLKGLPSVPKTQNKPERGVDVQLKRAMKKVGIDIEIKRTVAGYSADYYYFHIDDIKQKKAYNTEGNRVLVLDILRQELDPIEDKSGVRIARNVNFGAKATPDGFLFRVQKRKQEIMYGQHYYDMLRKGTLDAIFEWNGSPKVIDIYEAVHLMIAGTTGSGKSVALNGIIKGWQSSNTKDTLGLKMVNPKIDTSGGDLYSEFNGSYYLEEPILTQVGKSMETFLLEIDALLDRQIELMKSIEKKFTEDGIKPTKYHILAFDEVKAIFAIDRSNSDEANELNKIRKSIMFKVNIITAEGRSSKVLMLMATQSPTADVLGGVKANLTIMSLKVANDSQAGVCGFPQKGNDVSAKDLNGRGDGLISINGATYRIQCPM